MWEDMEEVAVVGDGTSGELSTSLRVLGERMETGWEHRTLCKEIAEWECLSQRAHLHSALSSIPSPQVSSLTVPGRKRGDMALSRTL